MGHGVAINGSVYLADMLSEKPGWIIQRRLSHTFESYGEGLDCQLCRYFAIAMAAHAIRYHYHQCVFAVGVGQTVLIVRAWPLAAGLMDGEFHDKPCLFL